MTSIPRRRAVGVEALPDGAVHARVWAPLASEVAVVWDRDGAGAQATPLQPEERGYFAGYLPGAAAGTRYRFRLDGDDTLAADPASRFQPEGVHGPSAVVDPAAFGWNVNHWQVPPLREWVIYELHVGTFTPEGTFDAIIPHLPYLKDLGVTTLELLPVAQFPGERNWGYDAVFPWAAQNSYGGPDGLRRLVDACHREDMALILDVIYNHLGPEGNVLHRFGPYFTAHYCTPWGDAINYDGPGSDEVRAFFIESALMWLEECRVDGFRIDAVHEIYDPRGQPFLAELAAAVHGRAAELGRQAVLIAESDLNDPKLILPRDIGGYGLDAQWADDFCHALEVQLVGEASPYADDFGEFAHLAKAMRQGFVYTGEYQPSRQRRFGRPPAPARRDQFVVFIQNHDQVGNRPGGERIGHHVDLARRKLAAGAVLLSPFVPLLFMGEEYGEINPFLFLTHHGDPALVEAVRKGRQEEFARFSGHDAAPDPQDPETFARSKLLLERHGEGEHAALHAWYRELLRLRRHLPVLTDATAANTVIAAEAERVLLRHATDCDGEVAVILGFTEEPVSVSLPIPAGEWTCRLDADDPRYGGAGSTMPGTLRSDGTVEISIPANGVVVYARHEGGQAAPARSAQA
jgi:maltooligosyltrehalose trehalohydrolase